MPRNFIKCFNNFVCFTGRSLCARGSRYAVFKSWDGGQNDGLSCFLAALRPAVTATVGQKLCVGDLYPFIVVKVLQTHIKLCFSSSAYFCFSSRSCEEVEKADEEETIYHIKCATVNGSKSRDFVFLLSKRQPCKNGYDSTANMTWFFLFWDEHIFNVKLKLYFYPHRDPYVIALRSVTVATVPPEENSIRSEAICAGFLVHEMGYLTCKVPTTV